MAGAGRDRGSQEPGLPRQETGRAWEEVHMGWRGQWDRQRQVQTRHSF